jgi:hypothetical protein
MIYDSTDLLSPIWSAGQHLGNFKLVIPADSWETAYDALSNVDERIQHIQVWGHGTFGKPVINNNQVDLTLLKESLKKKITGSSVIWFRSCSVFAGDDGHDFAKDVTQTLDCKVAAHTFIVSNPWITHQSGGHGLMPGQIPYWSKIEGIDADGKSIGSSPWKPNTCLVTDMMVPKNWWKV